MKVVSETGSKARAGAIPDWVYGLLLFLAVIAVYQPIWYAGYIWDDDRHVTVNPYVIGPLGLKEIWTPSAGLFFPLVLTTWWAEHAVWGLNPLGYHLVDVGLHAAAGVVLWRVLLALRIPGAWLGAALWALHPLQVESAAWVSETKNTQSGLFYLLAILFFVRWLRTSESPAASRWNYPLTLLFSALAMASKSTTVVLPAVLALCAWWVDGKWHWRRFIHIAPLVPLCLISIIITVWPQPGVIAPIADPRWVRSWPERIAASGDVIWFYLGKLIWPHPLITIYPRWVIDVTQWNSYVRLVAVITVLIIFWLKRDTWSRPWLFASLYFLIVLSPFLGFIDQSFWRFSFVEDHLQYLAGIGPLALAGSGLERLCRLLPREKFWLKACLYSLPLLIFGILTWQRTWAYASEETLWSDTVDKNPNAWIAYNNLGNALLHKGQLNEAAEDFQQALLLYPNFDLGHFSLGNVLVQAGHVDAAMAEYEKALEMNPNLARAHSNLGNIFLKKGRLDDAIEQYSTAARCDPYYPQARNNLGTALLQKGRVNEAIEEYEKALALKPDFAQARANLDLARARSEPAKSK